MKTNLAQKNPQQIFVGGGRKTIAIYGSAAGQVAVHEDLTFGEHFKGTTQAPYRYFISVDGKMRQQDALRDFGGGYWWGKSKSEATRDAQVLAEKINQCALRIDSAKQSTLKGSDILILRGQEKWESLVGRYNSAIE